MSFTDRLKALWANRVVERFTWTAVEVGAGLLAVHFGASQVAGVSVALLVVLVKEFAVAKLAEVGGPPAA